MQNKPNLLNTKIAVTLATTMTTNYQLPTTNYSKQTQSNPTCGEQAQRVEPSKCQTACGEQAQRVEPPVVSKRSASNHFSHSKFLLKSVARLHLSPCYGIT
jgi:hypothetical protein